MPSAFAASSADGTVTFDSVITGTTADTEYTSNPDLVSASIGTNMGAKLSTYIFNNDGSAQNVRIGGIHVANQYLNVNVRAKNGATLLVDNGISSYLHNTMNVVADKIVVSANNREGVFADGAAININGDVEINATGDNGRGLVAYLDSIIDDGSMNGTYSTASLKVDGTAKIESVNHAIQASGADINITDRVDVHSTDGIAVRAMAYRAWTSDTTDTRYSTEKMANVSIVGGKIVADKYDAIHNEGSNVYLNSEGKKSLVVKGDVVMLDRNSHTANTIMKLVDDESSWTGGLYTANYMIDNGANMQLTLQNGGTWTNIGEDFNVYEGDGAIVGLDYTATVANLTGGADEASAGLIFQNTSRDLNIKNYSGYTKVFYDHANDGTTISDYSGGDIIVGSAAKDAHIDIITDKEGINSANTYQVNTVLNNLAQKLVYTGAIIAVDEETGETIAAENNLTGQAIIAEGLTSNSQAVAMNKITFDKETGRGYLGNYISQLVTDFTTPLTGVAANDKVYEDAYVLQETGEYKFTKDSSISVSGNNAVAIDLKAPATIIAGGSTLALNVTEASGNAAGINMGAAGTTQMGATALAIKTASSNSAYGIFQTAGNNVIDSDIAIEVSSSANAGAYEKTIGVYANDGTLTINGDVNATVTNNGIGFEHYGSHGLYATGKGGSSKGADIVVNGKVTFAGVGNGLTTNMGGASITVDSVDITVDKDSELNYAALRAENGTINVNIERDTRGAIVGGAGNAVNIKGNVGLGDGAVYFQDILGTESALNLALNTADSTLQGVIFNQYATEGVVATGSNVKFTGDSNLWLQNGASWINEQYGGIDTPNYGGLKYAGSFVSNFVGGSNTYTAGNIFQNDTNPLTIGNYSGMTNIFYAHTGDGTASENYAAGDTIVNHAAEGSSIYMLTDNSNITVENRAQVNKVLNALAGKLVYTGFIGGEDNLQGMVGIAEGLTSSSAVKVVKGITFSEKDGRGSYSVSEHGSDTFNAPITGTEDDTEYLVAGVTSDYSEYSFDPLDYESKTITINSGDQPGIIFNSGKDVYIDAPLLNIKADGGITASRDAENPWMGSYLMINTINEEGASGKVIINKETGDAINATADVRIYGQAELTSGGNGLVATIVGTNPGSIEITKGTTIQAENHGILAEGGSVMLDSGYNNIVAKGDAIHAVAVEVNPEGTAYKTGGYVYVEGGNIESTDGKAVYSNGGTIYINVGGDKTTTMKGNVEASNGSQVNIKLTDADSLWEGHLSNTDSNVEMTLTNDAQWLNGDGAMRVNSVYGAETLDSAANIFRGAGDLTIDYLSGAMNFYYAHANDGDKVEDYADYGDTFIKSAGAGSVVKLITDKNDNFDIEKIDTYKGVLDALAHKLVYSGFASERNLNGYVAIAEGLTSSSAELTVNTITFSNTDGRGSYIEVHENGITGTDEDTRYNEKGEVTGEYNTYNFGSQNGVNMVIPNVMLQVVDKPLDVTINSVEALDFKEKVYVSPDNTVTINAPGININNGWINAIDSAGGKIVLNGAVNVYTAAKGLVADTVVKTEAQEQLNRAGVIDINESANITSYGESVFANGGTININKGGKFDTRYGDYPDAMTVTSDAIVAMEKVVTPYGDASEAELYQGVVNIKGDASHRINIQSNTNALYSEGGIINVNTDGKASYVEMSGFISGHASENGTAPVFNVTLNNEDSRWEGRIRVDDQAKVNLTLQDGATWATYRYYQADNNTPELYLNNRVYNFVGSTDGQKAGIIRMNDYINLNLENYSGNTILYYDHLMGYDGTEKWHYENGVQKADVHVGKAAEGSVITVMTDSYDINLNNQEQVNKVLNTLASFLVYDGYVQGERNLTGQVAIAESLTATDLWAVLEKDEAKEMGFDETGRGYYEGVVPGVYKSAITGTSADTEYSDRGVVTNQDPMTDAYIYNQYDFTAAANGNLVVVPNIAIEYGNNVTVNSEVDMQVDGGIKVLYAKELTMNGAEGTTLNIDTEGAAAVTTSGGTVNINSDMVIKGTGNGLESIFTEKDGVRPVILTVNGDVKAETDGYAVFSSGGYLTINGVVDLKSKADAVVAKAKALSFENGNAKVAIQGGSISSENGYAIYNEGSDVKINDGGTTTTVINGNIYQKDVSVGADWHTSYYAPTTTLKLTDADSAWNGSLEGYGSNTFNLTLQNGAIWTDAVVANNAGNTISSFTGSTGEQAAGNIFRNDTRNLTISNYSGNTNIYYEHAADDYTNYTAGATIINSAAAGSNVTLITQHEGIDTNDETELKAALNALAGKLFYLGYTTGQNNLAGKVSIAESLTVGEHSVAIKDIVFNPNNGQGTFGQGPFIPDNQTDAAFTEAITGNRESAYVYSGVAKADVDGVAQYVFQKDSSITTNSAAIATNKNVNIDATGKTLTLDATADRGIVNNGGNLNITGNVDVTANGTVDTAAIYSNAENTNTVITGNVNVNSFTTNAKNKEAYGIAVENASSKITINGNVTMKGENGGYGVSNGDAAYDNSPHVNKGVVGMYVDKGQIMVDGNVDLKVDGTGVLAAFSQDARIDITGGGTIEVNANPEQNTSGVTKGNYALEVAAGGNLTMNYKDGEPGSNKVVLKGNIGMLTPDPWGDRASNMIVALTTADSTWNGVMHNGYYGGESASEGEATLYLQNGATWTNEKWGETFVSKNNNSGAYTGSTWENFIGGESAAKAGNIHQKDSKNINLVNYSGWTNVYYDHNVAEDGAISFVGGDTIITNAAAKSGITLLTDKNGVTGENLNDVLNSLANKLIYKAYISSEKNLTGKVGIVESLTTPTYFQQPKDISFDENTGKGYYTSASQGDDGYDKVERIVLGEYSNPKDFNYLNNTRFIETDKEAIKTDLSNLTINADNKIVEVNVESNNGANAVLFTNDSWEETTQTFNVDALNVNFKANSGTSAVVSAGYNKTTIKGDVKIVAENTANNVLNGIYVFYNSDCPVFTITGDLTMRDGENYGITNHNTPASGMSSNYAVTGILASGIYKRYKSQSTVNVIGNVDLLIDGTAVVAHNGGVVNLNGGGSIIVNDESADGVYNYALETFKNSAYSNLANTINFNANAAEDKDVTIKGNVGLFGGGSITIGLATADSSWTGVMHDVNGTNKVTLKNGATWNNEKWGKTYDAAGAFAGSVIDTFVGGSNAETAGNIYQNDSNALTLSNYSGWTNVYYAHEDGTPTTMIGGDTIIGSAAAGSGITLLTQNNGVTEANVANVLNALAQKLVFNGNGSLTGKLSIAEGLTSGGITATGDITFVDGRGTYNAANAAMVTALERGIMLTEENGSTEEGTVTPDAPVTPVEPVIVTTPLVAAGNEVTVTDQVKIQLTEKGDAITAKGTESAPGVVAVLNDAFISAESGSLDKRIIYGNAVYAEGSNVALNPEGGKELIIKGDVVLKGTATQEAVAGSSASIVLDTATSSWQGNLYNDDASSAAVTLQNGAIWNNRDNNREEALGITGHRVSSFNGGATAEAAGNFFQNNKEDMVFDQYSGYTKVFFGHLNDGSDAKDYTAGNLIINSAAAGSGITMITNQSYNIDVNDEEQVNKILNSLAGKLFYNGYANGERNLTANVQIAESLTGSSKFLTGGVLNFNSNGQGYYGKQVHVSGIYTTDITGSTADSEFINAGVTEDYKSYNFTDSVEGASKVILQGIKVAGDTGNHKDEKEVTINIIADQAELNDSINIGYRGTVDLKANTVTIKGVENTAIDNYGGTLKVDGNVEISDVANGIHTNSKAEVAGAKYIGTVDIKGQAKITAENTAIATEGGVVSVGAGSEIISTNGDAIVAQGQRLFSMQVGYYDREVAGKVNVAGGTISAAKGNAINAAGGQVYVNKDGGKYTKITGNILVAKDTTAVGSQTEETPQQSIVDITLNTKDSSWKGSLSVAEGQMMNLTLQNGATWTDAISALAGNTITSFIGGASSDNAGTIVRNDTRDLTIDNYSGWTNIYYEHEKDDATKMIGGDTIIKKAVEGSGINMITGSYGVNTDDKQQVADVLNALANKLFYEEAVEQKDEENGAEAVMFAAANDDNSTAETFKLQAKAVISEGLTTSAKVASGTISFKAEENGQGFVTIDDVEISGGKPSVPPVVDEDTPLDKVEIVTGGEPVTMRAIKSSMAAATMMWRSENNDLMKRMGDLRVLEGERGLWAKYYTGKQEMDAQDTNFSEKYKAYQIGYDTKVNENWIVGAALSYNDGTSSTSNVANGVTGAWANGHGEQKNISLGVYGSWKAKDGQYADIIMKASRLNNEYNLKFNNGIGTYDIDGDYKTWGTSISAEYGKRFEGDKGTYFEPSAELTYGHMAGKSYSAGTNYHGSTMYMDQDSFDTLVGRIGLRVGQKLEQGSYFAKLALAHEFSGDFDTRYNVDGADHNKTHLDFGDSWYELQIGGTAKLSANSMLYADFQRSFGGEVTEKWRVDAGLRFTF